MKRFALSLISVCSIFLSPSGLLAQEKSAQEDESVGMETASVNGESEAYIAKPVTGVYFLEFGAINTLSTYLSPLCYRGSDFSIGGNWSKAMAFNPESAIMDFNFRANFGSMLNPAKTARMVSLTAEFAWGMAWRKQFAPGWQAKAGGEATIKGGAFYLLRNGNNPVNAIADISLGITGSISKRLTIGRLGVLISDKVRIPSVGMFFTPGYGETYYEIYLGNRKGLLHAGWWGNNFSIDNLLSATLDFGKTAMMVGYRFNLYSSYANHLVTRSFTNSFVIGVIPGGIGLKKTKKRVPAETIYSIY